MFFSPGVCVSNGSRMPIKSMMKSPKRKMEKKITVRLNEFTKKKMKMKVVAAKSNAFLKINFHILKQRCNSQRSSQTVMVTA